MTGRPSPTTPGARIPKTVRGRTGVALTLIAALVAAACGGAAPSAGSGSAVQASGSSPVDGSASAPAVVLPADATTLAAAEAELDLRRALWAELDVAGRLGTDGPAAIAGIEDAQRTFGEAMLPEAAAALELDLTALRGLIASTGEGPGAVPAPAAEGWSGSTLGSPTFTASMLVGLVSMMVARAGTTSVGDTGSRTETYTKTAGDGRETIRITSRMVVRTGQGKVSADIDISTHSSVTGMIGIQTAELNGTAHAHVDIEACPNANGEAKGSFEFRTGEAYTQDGGSNSVGRTVTSPIRLQSDDRAHMTSAKLELATAGTGLASGSDPWSAGATVSIDLVAGGQSVGGIQSGGSATQANVNDVVGRAMTIAMMSLGPIVKAAETFWRGGGCIELQSSESSRKVPADEQLTISVTAKHKFDQEEVRAPITPTFSGTKSITPASGTAIPAPVSITFVAGSEQGDKGTIELEQVSKRGIARQTLEFEVEPKDYAIELRGQAQSVDGQLELTLPATRLTKTDRGFEATGVADVRGSVSILGCSKSVSRSMPVQIVGVKADRPPDEPEVFDILIAFSPAFEDFEEPITCQGATTNAFLPLSEFQGPLLGANGRVEVTVGQGTTFRDQFASVTVTITKVSEP